MKATFGAGCFWGIEAAFQSVNGVTSTSVGYMGGHFENPSYLDVVSRITGHAEVCQVEYNPALITYEELLDIFWHVHDPTSLNRQGADRGEQYRSVIFCHSPEQTQAARTSKDRLERSGSYDKPTVTQIVSDSGYWKATEDHQRYFEKKQAQTQRS